MYVSVQQQRALTGIEQNKQKETDTEVKPPGPVSQLYARVDKKGKKKSKMLAEESIVLKQNEAYATIAIALSKVENSS